MKENELRIGNYVFSKETGECQQITGITEENPFINAITFDYTTYDEIEPIPLTEEWLLKLGFYTHGKYKWHGNGYDYQPKDHWQERTDYILNDDFFIAVKEEYFNSELDSISMIVHNTEWHERCTENAIYAPIKYVHQLQNLYFALTGQELKITSI